MSLMSVLQRLAVASTGSSPRRAHFQPVPLLLVGVAVFLYLQLFLPNGVSIFMPADHWIFLERARQMLEGKILYRDIFQFTFPGTEATFAALLKVFGLKVWIPNAVIIVLGVGLAWLTTSIARKVLSGANALLPACLLLSVGFLTWHIASHHWFSTLPALAALLVMTGGRDAPRIVASGGLCGLSAWCVQTQGGTALAGLALFLVWERSQKKQEWRRLLRNESILLGSFSATLVLTNAYFAWRGGLAPFFRDTVVSVLRYQPTYTPANSYHVYMGYFGRWQWWEVWPQVFLSTTIPLVYVLFLFVYRRRRERIPYQEKECMMLVALVGALMLLGMAPAPSANRLGFVSPPAFILMAWMLGSNHPICRPLLRWLWFGALLSAVTVLYATIGRENVWFAYLDLPTGRVAFLDRVWFQEYRWLRDRAAPGDYFFGGNCAYYYYPLDLEPPSDVSFFTAFNITRPGQVARLVGGLESHHVRFVMWQTVLDHPPYYDPAADHLGPLRTYVRSHYRSVITFPVMRDELLERER